MPNITQLVTEEGNVLHSLSTSDFRKYRDLEAWIAKSLPNELKSPWEHHEIADFLPNTLLQSLSKNLPNGKDIPAHSSRSCLSVKFDEHNNASLNSKTSAELNWWGGGMLQSLWLATYLFQDDRVYDKLAKQYLKNNEKLNSHKSIFVQVRRSNENVDYSLGVHTDQPEKLRSLIIYLPSDATNQADGTSLYMTKEKNPEKQREFSRTSYYQDKFFRREKTIKFKLNNALLFCLTNETWHGKPKLDQSTRYDRFTLQVNYFLVTKNFFSCPVKKILDRKTIA